MKNIEQNSKAHKATSIWKLKVKIEWFQRKEQSRSMNTKYEMVEKQDKQGNIYNNT